MGKDKRKILMALMLFVALLFAACDVLETRRPYLETVVENYWNDWTASGNDSLNCCIDFAEVEGFNWDTMLYLSGGYYLSNYVKDNGDIKKYADLYAGNSGDEQVLFLLGDSVVHKMIFTPEFDFDMEVIPRGISFCTKKLYFKPGRDNAKFHLLKSGLKYKLYHMDDTFEEETSVKKENLSPYVGAWEWVSDDTLPRKVDVVIGERNDSLYIAFSWNFMDKGESNYYTIDRQGLPLAYVRMPRPQGKEVTIGKIFNIFLSENLPYVKNFENMQLTLHGNDTLAWNIERNTLWSGSLKLIRRNNFNYKFSPHVLYIHDDIASLQRLVRGIESLDFTY
ncbi:MAG: hypothetical protein E7089_07805 [Bacteroidales bacterium]|nr:hypothetical protein [Bacteroidales bacterium]